MYLEMIKTMAPQSNKYEIKSKYSKNNTELNFVKVFIISFTSFI